MTFPHGDVEHLPVRFFIVHVACEAAVDGVADNLKIIDHQVDAHIPAHGEQVHMILGEGEGG